MKKHKIFFNIFVFIIGLGWLLPLIWTIIVSFKPDSANVRDITTWFSKPFTLENYKYVLTNGQSNIALWTINSTLIACAVTLGTLILCSMAAFAFSKLNFKGRSFWFWFIMLGLMIPAEATLVPRYILFRNWQMLNTYMSLILPFLSAPFGVIVLKQFFDGLPRELFDAAKVDGCNIWKIYSSIILPLSKSSLAALGIFTFLGSWNNFTWPYITVTDPKLMTIPVGIPFFNSQYTSQIGYPMAANVLVIIPVLIVFVIFQKNIIQGVSFSGIKG